MDINNLQSQIVHLQSQINELKKLLEANNTKITEIDSKVSEKIIKFDTKATEIIDTVKTLVSPYTSNTLTMDDLNK